MNKVQTGIYKHSKSGKLYKVIGIVRHSETMEELVLYESMYDKPKSKYWVRPLKMFKDKVMINGKKTKRFKFISKQE